MKLFTQLMFLCKYWWLVCSVTVNFNISRTKTTQRKQCKIVSSMLHSLLITVCIADLKYEILRQCNITQQKVTTEKKLKYLTEFEKERGQNRNMYKTMINYETIIKVYKSIKLHVILYVLRQCK